jgi:hypothetical protein
MKLSAVTLNSIQHTANILGKIKNGILSVPSGTVIKLAFMVSTRYKIEDLLSEIYSHISLYDYKVVSLPESTVKDDELVISISIEITS